MHHSRAVQKLRAPADACESATSVPGEQPLLREAFVFGDVVDGTYPIDQVQVACTLDLPPDEVPWLSHPRPAVP